MLEAINMCEEIAGGKLNCDFKESNRIGDHIWWISDNSKFESQYPEWNLTYTVDSILAEIYEENIKRWT